MPRRTFLLLCLTAPVAGLGMLAAGWASHVNEVPAQAAEFRRPAEGDASKTKTDLVWRLGHDLFFDRRLSASGRTSCATCHVAGHGLAGTSPRAIGDGGKMLAFKSPTLLDVSSLDRLGWTGKFADMRAVMGFAMTSPTNMNMSLDAVAERMHADPAAEAAFRRAFGHAAIGDAEIFAALERYVSSLVSGDSPFDRWAGGNATAIGPAARRGFAIFTGKGRCAECHRGWAFTDGSYHDIGTAKDDLGRGKLFKTSVKLQHAFKTPGLRDVAERAPYMHDGSKATLEDVIDLYDKGGIERPSRAEAIGPLHLSAQEKADLVAFLKTLTSDTQTSASR